MIQDNDIDVVENNTAILRVNGRFITDLGFNVLIPTLTSYDDPSQDVYILCSEDFISKHSKTTSRVSKGAEVIIQKDQYILSCIFISKSRINGSFILRVDKIRET